MQDEDWRLLIHPPQSASMNMAIDEAIAIAFSEGKVPPTLRFYQWSGPSFSIGAFQQLSSEWLAWFENLSEKDPITLARRMTGGRGLFHDRELTYAVIGSTHDPLFSGGIKETFYAIATGLLAGLKQLGIDAVVYRPTKKQGGARRQEALCFASTSWYEIAVKNKKLIGSAQRRWRSHFLQQGSLMIERSRIPFQSSEGTDLQLISEHQLTLSELLPALPSHAQVAHALKSGFEKALTLRFFPDRLTDDERKVSERLVAEKYGNAAWNRDRKTGAPTYFGRDAQNAL